MTATQQLEHHLRRLEHDQTTLAHHAINLARDAISSLKNDKFKFLKEKKLLQAEAVDTIEEIKRIKHEQYETQREQQNFSHIHNMKKRPRPLQTEINEFKREETALVTLENEVKTIEHTQLKILESEIEKIEHEIGILHAAEQTLQKDVHSIITPEDLTKILSEVHNVTANVRQRVQEIHSLQNLGTKKLEIEHKIQSIVNRGKSIIQQELAATATAIKKSI